MNKLSQIFHPLSLLWPILSTLILFSSIAPLRPYQDFLLYQKSLTLLKSTSSCEKLEEWKKTVSSRPLIYWAGLDFYLSENPQNDWTEHNLYELRLNFEKEKFENRMILFMFLDKWKSFDPAFEPWLIEKGLELFPQESHFWARKYCQDFIKEKNWNISLDEHRKTVDFIESMLRSKENS